MERRSLLVQHAVVESVPYQRVLEHDLTGFIFDMYQIELMKVWKPIIGRRVATVCCIGPGGVILAHPPTRRSKEACPRSSSNRAVRSPGLSIGAR